MLFVLLQRSTQ